MNTKATGKNICRLLEERNMTQAALASRIGVTRAAMCRWCNGQRQPTPYSMLRMSVVLGVTMEALMDGTIEGRSGEMIRVNEKWIIDVDENRNYMPRVDKHCTETVKTKDGRSVERPAYGPIIGYYNNLSSALKGIVAKEFQDTVMAGEITLQDAIKALDNIQARVILERLEEV